MEFSESFKFKVGTKRLMFHFITLNSLRLLDYYEWNMCILIKFLVWNRVLHWMLSSNFPHLIKTELLWSRFFGKKRQKGRKKIPPYRLLSAHFPRFNQGALLSICTDLLKFFIRCTLGSLITWLFQPIMTTFSTTYPMKIRL